MGKRLGRFALEFVGGYALVLGVGLVLDLALADYCCGHMRLISAMIYGAPPCAVLGVAIVGWLIEKPRRLNLIGLGFGWLLALAGLLHTFMFGPIARISKTITEIIVPGITSTGGLVEGLVKAAPFMVFLAYVGWQAGRLIGRGRKVKENPVP